MQVPGWPEVFRGSLAVAAGLTTRARLRGPAFRRLLPDGYAPTGETPADLTLRSRAAARLVGGRGVLAGYSAAEILGPLRAPGSARGGTGARRRAGPRPAGARGAPGPDPKHEIRERPDLIVAEVTRARERRTIALAGPPNSDGVPLTGARRGPA